MGAISKIEWTDATWNPVSGCTKVSPGCKNCYAERITERWGQEFTEVRERPERLMQPLRWKNPRRVFTCSMADLFHEQVSFEFIASVFHTMTGECDYKPPPAHTYQILTKRAVRMRQFFSWLERYSEGDEAYVLALQTLWFDDAPARNVWLGVSVEDQQRAEERIPDLLATPAAVRFLSVEPLLGPVALRDLMDKIDWVIVGGESGPGARPMHPDWVRSIRDQCQAAGVPFFFKQWGGRSPKAGGRILDGRTWEEFP